MFLLVLIVLRVGMSFLFDSIRLTASLSYIRMCCIPQEGCGLFHALRGAGMVASVVYCVGL